MTVKVTFEFTHTADRIDVVSDIESVGEGCCTCEMAFAATTVANVKEVVGAISRALKADSGFAGLASDGRVH
ncbi:hypothetical protein H6W05_003560 [Salmonella enterica]|nr:hypothetical protein [Salmonella enterica]EKB5039438.1 hypothetical protein [Salmonella enterica]EME1065114.1 hypothetical protein [Salmonella enterica]